MEKISQHFEQQNINPFKLFSIDFQKPFYLKDLKKKYIQLARKYHPDKNPGYEKIFIAINEAYIFLKTRCHKKDENDVIKPSDYSNCKKYFNDFEFSPQAKKILENQFMASDGKLDMRKFNEQFEHVKVPTPFDPRPKNNSNKNKYINILSPKDSRKIYEHFMKKRLANPNLDEELDLDIENPEQLRIPKEELLKITGSKKPPACKTMKIVKHQVSNNNIGYELGLTHVSDFSGTGKNKRVRFMDIRKAYNPDENKIYDAEKSTQHEEQYKDISKNMPNYEKLQKTSLQNKFSKEEEQYLKQMEDYERNKKMEKQMALQQQTKLQEQKLFSMFQRLTNG